MCELAELQLGWVHLSTGDLLRKHCEVGGSHAKQITELLADGKLAPDDIMVGLLKDEMEHITRTTGKTNFLMDGFPRSLSNLDAWHDVFGRNTELPATLFFECPMPVLEKRILGRAPYSGRSDDNVDSMKLRFETFKAETLPIVEHFRNHGRCVEIDTSQDRQTVYRIVKDQLASHTSAEVAETPLSERAEMLLGLRPYPKTNPKS